ncbi:major tail sheath protein [Hartmannibacter diazotrophicus]|uniref:Major tail sheath protein n=1 Tax=Hartmannibacter diazotrophicus TaxID=1482074 RepID=A0A2C9D5D6_9HYPH|nr:phage tail protein [Hartmannibacter diazotrophicus]SON55537.1 major tail sheath protein [Hartmannibacter diazotrophicus]
MTTPTFGMTFTRPDGEVTSVLDPDFSKALIIESSEDADAAKYPVGTPVRISTSDTDAVGKLGTGYLADAVSGINAQLVGLNAGADVIILRVAEGADVQETSANIVAALATVGTIPSIVNATPRLIYAGRTDWQADAQTANPVVAALPAACETLLAIAVVDVDDTSAATAIAARETMSSQRLMPVGVAARVYEGVNLVTRPMAPRILGLFMAVDNNMAGIPSDPIANRAIQGLAGLSRKIPFSLLDGSTEGQQMLAANVSIVVQGETGVDGAASDGGFSFIGTDNADTGTTWEQIHQVRMADFVTAKMAGITRDFLGQKITADMVEAWLNSLKSPLRDYKADNALLGYDVKFLPSQNSAADIRLGTLQVNLGIEPCPAFKLAKHEIRRYAPAVDALVAEIVANFN